MFLASLNYFRAIAIIFIVIGHCTELAALSYDTLGQQTLFNLIVGGTVLFVFISGFLFHHIFLKKYQYKNFITAKAKNVLIPYLILSLPVIVWSLIKGAPLKVSPDANLIEYISLLVQYYWTGSAMVAYWYIPFILVTFLMAPLHILFIRQRTIVQLIIVTLLLLKSAVIHRSVGNMYVFQSVVYFLPIYLIGILSSIHKEYLYRLLKGREVYFLLIAIYFATLQVFVQGVGIYSKEPFQFDGIDLMLFQKLSLCFFFMIWLHRFEQTNVKLMEVIAATSFGIYFLHGYFLYIAGGLMRKLGYNNLMAFFQGDFLSAWLILIVLTALIIFSCVGIVLAVKKVIPNHSRYVTGY